MTAVEWLIEELKKFHHPTEAMIMYAKKLEKQQIIDAWNDVYGHIKDAEQYYSETYGSKGSDETKSPKINTWDDIFDNIESEMDCVVPLKVTNYLEEHYMKPTPLQTDENGKPLTYWGGVDFTNLNANNIKSGSTTSKKVIRIDDINEEVDELIRQNELTSSQTEISDEEIEKAMWEHFTDEYADMWSERLAFRLACKWYREQLKTKQ